MLLADRDEPVPAAAEGAADPVEARAAVAVHAREGGVAVRIRPRGVGHTDLTFAVGLPVAGLERLTPLALGDLAVRRELALDLLKVSAVTDRNELEAAGLRALDHTAVVLPLAGVAVGVHHRKRLVVGRVAVEGELEDFAISRVVEERLHLRLAAHDRQSPAAVLPSESFSTSALVQPLRPNANASSCACPVDIWNVSPLMTCSPFSCNWFIANCVAVHGQNPFVPALF